MRRPARGATSDEGGAEAALAVRTDRATRATGAAGAAGVLTGSAAILAGGALVLRLPLAVLLGTALLRVRRLRGVAAVVVAALLRVGRGALRVARLLAVLGALVVGLLGVLLGVLLLGGVSTRTRLREELRTWSG